MGLNRPASLCVSLLGCLAIAAGLPAVAAAKSPAAHSAHRQSSRHAAMSAPKKQKHHRHVSRIAKNPAEQLPLSNNNTTHAASSGVSLASFVRLIFVTIFVICLILLVRWLLKKYASSKFPGLRSSDEIEVIATTPLAANRFVHVVKIGEKIFVLGSTDQSVSRIGRLDESDLELLREVQEHPLGDRSPASGFASLLSGAVRKGPAGRPMAAPEAGSWLDRLRGRTLRDG